MAKVRNNIVIQGLSGSLGDQLVIRKGRGGKTIVGVMPNFAENREFNETQKAHQEAFRQAVTYAKSVKNEAVYLAKAEKEDKSSFNVAVADWFHKPEVVEIDSTGWDGQIGQQILVRAIDDVQVMRVMVLIGDGNGTILEQGVAEKVDDLWWMYTTTTQANGTRRVRAIAYDFPGHTTQSAWQN